MKTIKTVKEFVERINKKQSVSRFDFKPGFEWNAENSKILSSANLSSAKGEFYFNFGVKLKVVG